MSLWTLLAAVVFALSRAVVYFRFREYVTDVPLYQVAGISARQGLSAYCDFWFPYPPLSLPFVYLPAYFGDPNENYRAAFRAEMLIFDVICFAGIWMFLKYRTDASDRRRGLALTVYSLLGLGVGHLLFDRLDIVMTGIFIWSLFFFTSNARWGRAFAYLLLLIGALIKLLPIFLLPTFMILEGFSDDEKWPSLRRCVRPLLWVAVPFALSIVLYNQAVCGRLIEHLAEQGSRGIQIESNWALPLIVLKIFGDWPLSTDYIYGAFHIVDKGVPPLYLLLSKYVGFFLLVGLFAALGRRFYRSLAQTDRFSPGDIACLFYLPLLLIIGTQRVLSPQYLMWLMPLAAIQIALAKRPVAAIMCAAAAFSLTYVVFDIGFFPILAFHPWYSLVLFGRNMTLLVWMADLGRRVLKALRVQRRAVMAGA